MRYLEHKSAAAKAVVNLIYERALKELPGRCVASNPGLPRPDFIQGYELKFGEGMPGFEARRCVCVCMVTTV